MTALNIVITYTKLFLDSESKFLLHESDKNMCVYEGDVKKQMSKMLI